MQRVKVVILNWNGAHHLVKFLPSVVANTPEWAGIVVADNGSTDESVALLERDFPTVGVLRLDRNYGFAGGYNRAVAQVEAEYLVLLNSDVETPDGWLEPLVRTLDENPDVAAVAPKLLSYCDKSRFEYAGAAGGFIDWLGYPFCRGRVMNRTETDRGQYDDARDVFWASGAAFCCRRAAFVAAGGFDADFFAHIHGKAHCKAGNHEGQRHHDLAAGGYRRHKYLRTVPAKLAHDQKIHRPVGGLQKQRQQNRQREANQRGKYFTFCEVLHLAHNASPINKEKPESSRSPAFLCYFSRQICLLRSGPAGSAHTSRSAGCRRPASAPPRWPPWASSSGRPAWSAWRQRYPPRR